MHKILLYCWDKNAELHIILYEHLQVYVFKIFITLRLMQSLLQINKFISLSKIFCKAYTVLPD